MVKAAILEDVRKLKVMDYPEPKVEDNGILMKMELCDGDEALARLLHGPKDARAALS